MHERKNFFLSTKIFGSWIDKSDKTKHIRQSKKNVHQKNLCSGGVREQYGSLAASSCNISGFFSLTRPVHAAVREDIYLAS